MYTRGFSAILRPKNRLPSKHVILQVLYEKWARPGRIIPRKWISDEGITALIRQYYGIPVAVYFCWLRYYTVWLVGPAVAGLVWFLYGLMTTRNDVPTWETLMKNDKLLWDTTLERFRLFWASKIELKKFISVWPWIGFWTNSHDIHHTNKINVSLVRIYHSLFSS